MNLSPISRIFTLALLILCAGPALAQTKAASESHLAVARQLVAQTQIAKSFDAFVPQLGMRVLNTVTRTRPELKKDLDEILDRLVPELDKEKAALIEKTAGFYTEAMTEAELKAVVDFNNTPAGKKFLAQQPKVLDRMVVIIDDWNRDLSQRLLERVREEMKKKGHDL